MIKIGYYSIRGMTRDRKHYKIYADAADGKINLQIEERKITEPVMLFALNYSGIAGMGRFGAASGELHGFIAWRLDVEELDAFLNSFHNSMYEKYHSFRMELYKKKIMDVKVLAKI